MGINSHIQRDSPLPSLDSIPSLSLFPATRILVTDRDASDVEYARLIESKVKSGTATEEELGFWTDGRLKGIYNTRDLNRVNSALVDAREICNELGLSITFPTSPKTNWVISDEFASTEQTNLLTNLSLVRNAMTAYVDLPEVPTSLQNMTYETANTIELILYKILEISTNATSMFRYVETEGQGIYSGGQY